MFGCLNDSSSAGGRVLLVDHSKSLKVKKAGKVIRAAKVKIAVIEFCPFARP